ncbi:unnamed protein product [Rotaria sordida]|uniref:Uncharacterized protein n=1 Tax=Rotaria sordida TaxID=392033 RepID=A0A818ZB72_9BILA|nr:unnamed protein product [Rotaria sordida]CAF3762411.1 unnamed protein product [Rotaria sordida]
MPQKFRCGRLILHKNGGVRKLHLSHGGGTRDCKLSHIDMGFDQIHDQLRDIFSLNETNRVSTLYDFQRKKLDTQRYQDFYDYINKNGLKFNATLLYLCTPAVNERTAHSTSPKQTRTTTQSIQNQPQVQKKISLVEADSSTSMVMIKIDDNDDLQHNHISTNENVGLNPIAETLRTFSLSSFSNYSFEKSLNGLVDYLRHLVTQYNHENIFLKLFELLCELRVLSSINLDRLKQQIELIDEKQEKIDNEILDKIEKSSRSVKVLIELNKIKISHIDQHSIIIDSFNQFYQNFNTLHDQWTNNKNNNRQSAPVLTCHLTGRTPSINHSVDRTSSTTYSTDRTQPSNRSINRTPSKNHPIDQTSSTTYSTDRTQLSNRSTDRTPSKNHPIDRTSSTTYSTDRTQLSNRSTDRTPSKNHPIDRTSSTTYSTDRTPPKKRSIDRPSSRSFSSSSPRSHSRKQSRVLSPSPHRSSSSSYRKSTEEDKDNHFSLFKNILKSLDHLSNVLDHLRFTSFYYLVKSIVGEIKSCRSTINLSDYRSLRDGEQTIISIERRLTKRMNDEYHHASPHGIDRQLDNSFNAILDSIRQLLISLRLYQSQIKNNKRPRTTRWSSPNISSSIEHNHIESKPIINLNQQDIKIDDDQSSEASHSSLGDEILMEVAKNAYEHRPDRYK